MTSCKTCTADRQCDRCLSFAELWERRRAEQQARYEATKRHERDDWAGAWLPSPRR